MSILYKVLGQSNPSATTPTTLYTAPVAKNTVVSSVVISNLSGSQVTYRIAVRPNGASLANTHYVAYDATCPGSDSVILSMGLTMAANDVITVYASTGSVNFSAFGSEIG
jgi:hypothetical protein